MPGLANDIGIGGDGSVWHVGTDTTDGGHKVYKWVKRNRATDPYWVEVTGGAENVALDVSGKPWLVTDADSIPQPQ